MFRNPISAKRLQFLTARLESKLKSQPEVLAKLQPKLQYLVDCDSSPSGEYCGWILNLLVKKDIDLPEDAGKLQELLHTFHRVKQRLPLEFRDINKFKSYSQLRVTLLPMLPTLKSVSELELEGSEVIASEVITDAVYQIYKLTTPEAASAAAKGSGWCVCDKATAKQYLDDGPLYLLTRNDKRHALMHEKSYQVMDVNDIPLKPDDSDHYYKDVMALLRKYLPSLICGETLDDEKRHELYSQKAKKMLTGNNICNLVCNDCDMQGCLDCGCAPCEIEDDCSKQMCYKHNHICTECHKSMCSEHMLNCCRSAKNSESICTECAQSCARCDDNVCDQCSRYVDCCGETLCESHSSGSCEGCDETLCDQHTEEMKKCGNCDNNRYYCDDCREEWLNCDSCSETVCPKCTFRCQCCGDMACKSCANNCETCKNYVCYSCDEYCNKCREHHCNECPEENCAGQLAPSTLARRPSRKHHFHGSTYQCSTGNKNEDANCYDQDFCEECIFECIRCEQYVCNDHARPCGCENHAVCERCSLQNVCTGCGESFCYPDQHIQCAYIRKKLRRRW